jgi:diadenosine tetraphosphate (Ap4A) HIT family hydrolase
MCLFCERVQDPAFREDERFLLETETVMAFLDSFPVTTGHALIIPKQHVADLFELGEDVYSQVFSQVRAVKELLQVKGYPAEGFNLGVNVGAAAGQTIGHVHVHLIPRNTGDTAYDHTGDVRGGVRWVVPTKAAYWEGAPFHPEPLTQNELDALSWTASRQLEISNIPVNEPGGNLHTGWTKLCYMRGTLDPVEEWLEAEASFLDEQD